MSGVGLRMVFTFLNDWGLNQKKNKYFMTHKIQISASIQKVLLEQNNSHLFGIV